MSDEPAPLSRRLVAEALGSAILVATVVGSGIMAEQLAGVRRLRYLEILFRLGPS